MSDARGESTEEDERELYPLKLAETEPEGGRFGHYLIETVYAFILVVTVSTWTVIGFAVWLPLLVRTTTLLAGSVFYASLFRDQARVVHAHKSVYFAVRFYMRGFQHFIAFYRQRHEPDPLVGLLEPMTAMRWRELLIECIWVLGVWVMTYFLVHFLVVVVFQLLTIAPH